MTPLTILSIFFGLFLSYASAVPVKRDVVDPPITTPTAATIWYTGQTQTVTWDTSTIPTNPTTITGMLILGYFENNSENLNFDSPLASGFKYTDGQAQITIPDVPTRNNYIIVLFGDSGNASPQFTIVNGTSSSTTSTTTTASTTTSSESITTLPTSTSSAPTTTPTTSATVSPAATATAPPSPSTTTPSTTLAVAVSSTSTLVTTVSSSIPSLTTQMNAASRTSQLNQFSLLVVAVSILLFI